METKAHEAESRVDTALAKDEALKHAILAAELYMKATKLASNDGEKARLRQKSKDLLSRAEEIKTATKWPTTRPKPVLKAPLSERSISRREEVILLEGSKLNGFIFPPWTADPETFVFEEDQGGRYYTEPAELNLSEAQRGIFAGWMRVTNSRGSKADIPTDDLMVPANEIDLVQDITTDCSVVASLCAGTARSSKGHDQLFASIIHPYDKVNDRARISKSGKYIFRLHFNGCFRKVVIDDRLPKSRTTRRLHVIDRNNPQLLWPALLEKAYLKVRGGYDFPGSNSGTDLWVLTGWIPEQVFLQSGDVQTEQLWHRVRKAFEYGDVMITLGTGELTRIEEMELGLAGEHDYAILDLKEAGSQHLLLIKNPWCDGMIWKGSTLVASTNPPTEAWAKDLHESLPEVERTPMSPGTFWMTFEDVAQHFESLYLNWNPGLFRHRQDHHFSWTIPQMKNPGSFTHNPQFSLSGSTQTTVWILLSRHFVTGEQELRKEQYHTLSKASSPLGFISLYIFEANGQRVHLSDDALHRGAYVDSPQTLARLEFTPSTSYTVVVAQHGLPLPKYSFTLSFFSRSTLLIDDAVDRLSKCSTHMGSWTLRSAGGNASSPTYPSNPQYSINVPSRTDIVLILETDREELAVHVKMVWAGGERVSTVTARDIVGSSGEYRRGCALASLNSVATGKYTIVCSTFEAGQLGNFTLRVGSMVDCEVRPILSETAGRLSLQLPLLVFQDGVDRMLAPLNVTRMTQLRILGKNSTGLRSRPLLKISVERGQGPNKSLLNMSGNGEFSDAPMGIRTNDLDLSPELSRQGGLWIVVERLGGRHDLDAVELEVLSDSQVTVGLWGRGDG